MFRAIKWKLRERRLYLALTCQYYAWRLSKTPADYVDYERRLNKWIEHLWVRGMK